MFKCGLTSLFYMSLILPAKIKRTYTVSEINSLFKFSIVFHRFHRFHRLGRKRVLMNILKKVIFSPSNIIILLHTCFNDILVHNLY